MSARGAPSERGQAVWADSRLFVFAAAGSAVFDPCANSWSKVQSPPTRLAADNARPGGAVAMVVGKHIYSHGAGLVYDIRADSWHRVPERDAPPTVVGGQVRLASDHYYLAWGGVEAVRLPNGGTIGKTVGRGAFLDPLARVWVAMPSGPSARSFARAAIVGTQLALWGGLSAQPNPWKPSCGGRHPCALAADGHLFDPETNSWRAMSTAGMPPASMGVRMYNAGAELVLWGGVVRAGRPVFVGGRYNPATDSWRGVADLALSLGRHPKIVGGLGVQDRYLLVGTRGDWRAAYDTARDCWTSIKGAPPRRTGLGVVLLGETIGVRVALPHARIGRTRGARSGANERGSVAAVDPVAGRWRSAEFPQSNHPDALFGGHTVWTGDRLINWGATVSVRASGSGGCGPGPHPRPCDPVTPTKQRWLARGVMLRPTLQ